MCLSVEVNIRHSNIFQHFATYQFQYFPSIAIYLFNLYFYQTPSPLSRHALPSIVSPGGFYVGSAWLVATYTTLYFSFSYLCLCSARLAATCMYTHHLIAHVDIVFCTFHCSYRSKAESKSLPTQCLPAVNLLLHTWWPPRL